jgi:hypothetical protein
MLITSFLVCRPAVKRLLPPQGDSYRESRLQRTCQHRPSSRILLAQLLLCIGVTVDHPTAAGDAIFRKDVDFATRPLTNRNGPYHFLRISTRMQGPDRRLTGENSQKN